MRRRTRLYRSLGLVLLVLGVAVAIVGVVSANPGFPFATNPFLSRKATVPSEAGDYYAAITAPGTLADWKTLYFPDPNINEHNRASAYYYNAGDLGFGREMHCYDEDAFSACYVTNHGLGAAAPAELSAQDLVNNTHILPTVAMVYTYSNTRQPNDVKFYVYDTNGDLLYLVGLDSEGNKAVPGLCLACHGGDYDDVLNEVNGANFLPWDIDSFVYSTTPGFTKNDQLEQLRKLNAITRWIPEDPKILNLIDGWYGGVGAVYNTGAPFNGDYIPPAFNGSVADQNLYTVVVKPYCRGCHMAQGVNLETPGQVDAAAFYPVFVSRDMPHAQLTSHRFWSTSAPFFLARRFAGTSTFVVTKTEDANDGTCDADCSLREAVAAANASADYSVIVFEAPGTFALTRIGNDDTNVNGDLDIIHDLTILGNSIQATIIDGNGTDRVFHIRNGAYVLIQNVTIQGGASAVGAGIRVVGSGLVLNYSVVRDNHATAASATSGAGSGLSVEDLSDVEINQSAFINNTGTGLGGALFNYSSNLAVNNTTFTNNLAHQGGAAYNDFGGSLTLDHDTIIFNDAITSGGGVVTNQSSVTSLINSILANSAPAGPNCVIVDGNSSTFTDGVNVIGQNGSTGGCPTSGVLVPAGSISAVLNVTLATDPVRGIPGYLPRGGGLATDAIPVGADCSTPSYDAFNLARPRDADNNGVPACDVGAVELLTTPIYLPLVKR